MNFCQEPRGRLQLGWVISPLSVLVSGLAEICKTKRKRRFLFKKKIPEGLGRFLFLWAFYVRLLFSLMGELGSAEKMDKKRRKGVWERRN